MPNTCIIYTANKYIDNIHDIVACHWTRPVAGLCGQPLPLYRGLLDRSCHF